MKKSILILELRGELSDIRYRIQKMILEDPRWEGALQPSVGGCTCVIQSLYDAFEEMEKYEKRES